MVDALFLSNGYLELRIVGGVVKKEVVKVKDVGVLIEDWSVGDGWRPG